jgi:tetratricopeptide (TPR) repeat protein
MFSRRLIMEKGRSAEATLRKLKRSLLSCVVAGVTALSIASTASAASLEMGSYSNPPGGKEIEARDFDAAIAAAARPSRRFDSEEALIASTNLCVAYTIEREFDAAEAACAEALTLSRRADRVPGTRIRKNAATARALTNRGVLRALTGDSLSAAADFREAERLNPTWDAPSRNLAYLESSPAHRLAMARATD